MASYHCAVKIIGRGKGRSATAAAAYRSGSKMRARSAVAAAAYRSGERFQDAEGQWHDYSNKEGVLHTEILGDGLLERIVLRDIQRAFFVIPPPCEPSHTSLLLHKKTWWCLHGYDTRAAV